MDENPGVGILGGFHFALELKVLELGIAVLAIEEVGAGSLDLDGSVLDRKGLRILGVDLPALESFAVKHLDPLSGKGKGGGGGKDDCE